MKIQCNLYKQDGKNYIHYNDTGLYFNNLELTFRQIDNGLNLDFINFAFVTLCASTLEASLNHIIFTHFIDEFGPKEYKKFTDSLINLSFGNKLHTTPLIVTKSKYFFNKDSSTIKSLEELISLRNKILHKKPILQETKYEIGALEDGMEITMKDQNHIKRITKNKCKNFNQAILSFKNEFMDPFLKSTDIKETDLVKKY